MTLGTSLIKKLEKSYPRKTKLEDKFRGNDLTIKTNYLGEAITLFIGLRKANGDIKGEHYTRTMVKDRAEKIIKSHWDNKRIVG